MVKFINAVLGVELEATNELVIEQLHKSPDYVEVLDESEGIVTVDNDKLDLTDMEITAEEEATETPKKASKKAAKKEDK